jgi:O-antigen ligase
VDFFLFLLVNFTLFVRPAEIFPAIAELPIYNYTILAAFAFALPKVVDHLRPDHLSREPITFCVLGLLAAVVMSHLVHIDTWSAREKGFEFLKVVIYYLLLISVVNSTRLLKRFLYCIAIFTTISSSIAMLDHFEYIEIPSLTALRDHGNIDEETGEEEWVLRLRATGIFNDPNDLSMIAVAAFVISLFGFGDRQLGISRFTWLVPAAILLVTIALTKSRGGAMALGAAVATLSYFRFGVWKTGIIVSLFIPLIGVMLAGRKSSFEGGTGESRVEIWSEALQLLRQSPIFGIGSGNLAEEIKIVAHNSFVHCYAELGLVGGGLFLGAFWFAAMSLRKLGDAQWTVFQHDTDPSFRRLRPTLLAVLIGFIVSMLSLSRAYIVPTYLVLGLSNVYCLEARQRGIPLNISLTPRRLAELLPLSLGFLAALYLFIKLTVR